MITIMIKIITIIMITIITMVMMIMTMFVSLTHSSLISHCFYFFKECFGSVSKGWNITLLLNYTT